MQDKPTVQQMAEILNCPVDEVVTALIGLQAKGLIDSDMNIKPEVKEALRLTFENTIEDEEDAR